MGDSVGGMLGATIGQLISSLQSMSGTFSGVGMTFLSLAVILSLLGGIYSWWTSGSFQDLASNGVRMIIVIAPLLILLNGWGGYMNSFQNFFYRDLPSHLGISGGTPEVIVGNSVQQLMDAVKIPDTGASSTEKHWLEKAWEAISLKTFYSLILTTIAFVLNVLLVFAMIFAVFMPVAGLHIGVIFGPLILAWLPWRPLADMSARWIAFMIASGINFVVALVIIKALSNTVHDISMRLSVMADDGFMSGFAGYTVSLVALFAIYIFAMNLLLQANNIASSMTGGTSIGEGLFGKLAAVTAASGALVSGRLAAAVHGKAAKAVGRAAVASPGAVGKAATYLGEKAHGAGASVAGNALRSIGSALNTVQSGINKTGEVLGKAADRAKDTDIYKLLNKPLKP